jgi:hypothetical protein
MTWLIFCGVAWMIVLVAVKPLKLSKFLKTGLITMALVFLVDSTGVNLGLYAFRDHWFTIAGIPLFYLIGSIPIGMALVYFVPKKRTNQFLYIGGVSVLLVLVELTLRSIGMIEYRHWNWFYSLELDALLIIVILTLHQTFFLWSIWRT